MQEKKPGLALFVLISLVLALLFACAMSGAGMWAGEAEENVNPHHAEKDNGAVGNVDVTASSTTCNSCSDCTNKLNGKYDTVILTRDLINVKGSCITFGASNVIPDGNGPKIDGDDTGEFESGIAMSSKSGNTKKKPDLRITDIICDKENHRIGYKIKNIGDATASKGHYTTLFVDGAFKIKEQVNVNLAPKVSSQRYFNYYSWQCTSPQDKVKVCADYGDFVDESNEENNCREETWQCAPEKKPDLQITDISNDGGTICYEIKNIGDATAQKGHYTTLHVDGLYKIKEQVDVELAPGASAERCFDYYSWECTPPEDTVEVCADYGDFVDESNEENNCREETWQCAPEKKPDLVITDVWNEDGTICYQIRNIGEATAPGGHHSFLSIDGIKAVDDPIDSKLEPGERLKRCFNYGWQCSLPDDAITVCADHKDVVDEADEGNNCRNERWECDDTPPVIVSGPVVSDITPSSVAISWTTDEDSDSLVRFGRTAGKYEDQKFSLKMKQEHKIILTDLLPSTTYHYAVQSTDASENTVLSRGWVL